ncbi:MAG: DUF3570 domain-containing protein [Methylococcales bacterium]|nr:DUF3570 domain-containing protein [Methylococcales bacterium]
MAVIKDKSGQAAWSVLTGAALALPGMMSVAHADVAPLNYSLDTNFSRYAESAGRMKVDIYQAAAILPLTERLSLKFNGVKDVVTGASPVGPAAAGTRGCKGPHLGGLMQCMSGASISDVRDSVDVNATYYMDNDTVDVDAGRSSENDYASDFFSVNNRLEINDKLTTITTGYAYAADHVWEIVPIDGVKVRAANVGGAKETHQGILGLTQILDKDSLLQANLTYSYNGGYLSDPYKYVYAPWTNCTGFNCPAIPASAYPGFIRDTRPGSRNQIGILLGYVRNFAALNSAALHADYRFYADTWGVDSHTFEFSWIQPVVDDWQLTPRLRYYTQNSADFYNVMFNSPSTTGYYSSDYRLAGFGAIGGGLHLSKAFFNKLTVSGGMDFYKREYGYGISGGTGTALDNFTFSMFSVSLNLKF